MSVSIFDLFSVGIGPSSSHTMGPMIAAYDFVQKLEHEQWFTDVSRIQCELFGSLACTGKGHHTDKAILMGLEGHLPESVDPLEMFGRPDVIQAMQKINLLQKKEISFNSSRDFIFHFMEQLDYHVNGMRFSAFCGDQWLYSLQYYSVGGGFIVSDLDIQAGSLTVDSEQLPYPFHTAKQLLMHCDEHQLNISDIILANELIFRDQKTIDMKLERIIEVMMASIERGCQTEGILPGGLKVRRRAAQLYKTLIAKKETDPMLWLNVYGLAVNEENGAGGRIVTAPTNGAAGIIPAVLKYYMDFYPEASIEKCRQYLLTAGGIALLYKMRASISGAEVGCQGEVGVACSMAAGGFAEILGGDIWQVEKAAEMGMEHHLGLTCDPIGGLVQIPCIERNAMAAVRAVNAAKLTLAEDSRHYVSLDQVIDTMKKTGYDMLSIYKETSQGGLAVIYPEC